MKDHVYVYLYDTSGVSYMMRYPRQFVYRRERYMPYTELHVTVQDEGHLVPQNAIICRVQMILFGHLVHDGIIDRVEMREEYGKTVITVRSKGFTSLLMNNEMTPGLHTKMSLDKLMRNYYQFPSQILWDNETDDSNYIFVKPHRSMWDSVLNLAYKLYETYPYIRSTNTVCLHPSDARRSYDFGREEILSSGYATVGSKLLSHLHMQGIDDEYDVHNQENPTAAQMHIVRHKKIAFDRQYLNDPGKSMRLTFACSEQGWRSKFVTCSGYRRLELYDYVSAEGVFEKSVVAAVTVQGDANGVRSTYTVYEDGFSS